MTQRVLSYMLLGMLAASSLVLSAQVAKSSTAAVPLELPAVLHVVDCETLTTMDVSATVGAKTVISTAAVTDGANASRFCTVHVVVDDYANFDLKLPMSTWTQRLLFGGGPGAQTAIHRPGLEQFVTASWRDLGHRNHEDDFANNYRWRVNGAYRGMHWQVLAAKAIIEKFYGQPPRYSYFNACSEPGREGMMEVQRFPEDFDGVAAGCPPLDITVNNGIFQAWNVLTNTAPDGSPVITADKLPLLHKVVLDQCDTRDGFKSGFVADPFSCHPNLTVAECKRGEDAATCLTPAQVHVAEELYRGAHDSEGGKLLPIGVLPGSEMAWTATIVPTGRNAREAREQTSTAIRGQFSDPPLVHTWELGDLKFDRASFDSVTKDHFLYDAVNPDLDAFAKAGHKLILWQGMGDTNVLPAHAVLYYMALQKQMGIEAVEAFSRFYELPGVYHCGGGDGPQIADLLTPLMVWVERGIAPEALLGVHLLRSSGFAQGSQQQATTPAVADMTRPIYPYPYTARYSGKGDPNDPANWMKGPAQLTPASLGTDWFGAGFYTSTYQKWCEGEGTTFRCKAER